VRRIASLLTVLALTAAACSSASVPVDEVPPLPETSPEEMTALLEASEQPVVLNVWASWCVPCRSEAPLLRTAHAEYGAEIRFVGVAVEDTQRDARGFIAEFGLHGLEHFFDAPGAVPASLGGRGVPLTFFVAPGGDVRAVQRGVLDERTLAFQIDELLRLGD
jgi:cytochrome c biogenesis protein CcmG/thiol:disulfide interchange protein DsbE